MFDIRVTTTVDGKTVPLDTFIGALLNHITLQVVGELAKRTQIQFQSNALPVAPHAKPDPLVVNVQETARLLGLKPSTIRAMMFRRRIPFVRLGRRVLVPMEAIRKMVTEGIPRQEYGRR